MPKVHARIESARGCGYRKPGGMYLVGSSSSQPCCKLPFELTVCPCCGSGIKQSRGFTWISTDLFGSCMKGSSCIMGQPGKKIGLMWVGAKYYPSYLIFTREASAQGISKRIAQIPRGLIVGKTWVALAHPRAIVEYDPKINPGVKYTFKPGIFSVFIPTAIEYIITGKESQEKLDDLEARGITLVDLIKVEQAQTKMDL
jgi:hypothetical protein